MNFDNKKTIVLGLGNDILCDDAIGIKVVQCLSQTEKQCENLDFKHTCEMGLALLDYIVGYNSLIIIDSIKTGKVSPGTVLEIGIDDVISAGITSPHFLGVKETVELGKKLGLSMPDTIHIFAIEVEDPYTVSENLSGTLQKQLDNIIKSIKEKLFGAIRYV